MKKKNEKIYKFHSYHQKPPKGPPASVWISFGPAILTVPGH